MDDKEAKKRAALEKYVKSIENNLQDGVKSIRYWCCDTEADQCDAELRKCHQILLEMTADKKTIMDAVLKSEEIAYHLMDLFNKGLCGVFGYKVNTLFIEEVDKNYMNYINKVQKSVDAKQSHAPGFDEPR